MNPAAIEALRLGMPAFFFLMTLRGTLEAWRGDALWWCSAGTTTAIIWAALLFKGITT